MNVFGRMVLKTHLSITGRQNQGAGRRVSSREGQVSHYFPPDFLLNFNRRVPLRPRCKIASPSQKDKAQLFRSLSEAFRNKILPCRVTLRLGEVACSFSCSSLDISLRVRYLIIYITATLIVVRCGHAFVEGEQHEER